MPKVYCFLRPALAQAYGGRVAQALRTWAACRCFLFFHLMDGQGFQFETYFSSHHEPRGKHFWMKSPFICQKHQIKSTELVYQKRNLKTYSSSWCWHIPQQKVLTKHWQEFSEGFWGEPKYWSLGEVGESFRIWKNSQRRVGGHWGGNLLWVPRVPKRRRWFWFWMVGFGMVDLVQHLKLPEKNLKKGDFVDLQPSTIAGWMFCTWVDITLDLCVQTEMGQLNLNFFTSKKVAGFSPLNRWGFGWFKSNTTEFKVRFSSKGKHM